MVSELALSKSSVTFSVDAGGKRPLHVRSSSKAVFLDMPDLLLTVSELIVVHRADCCSCSETGVLTSLYDARAGTFELALTRIQIPSPCVSD